MAYRDALQAASRGWDALTIRRAFCGCQRDGGVAYRAGKSEGPITQLSGYHVNLEL
jgi:hypothetical protein